MVVDETYILINNNNEIVNNSEHNNNNKLYKCNKESKACEIIQTSKNGY